MFRGAFFLWIFFRLETLGAAIGVDSPRRPGEVEMPTGIIGTLSDRFWFCRLGTLLNWGARTYGSGILLQGIICLATQTFTCVLLFELLFFRE